MLGRGTFGEVALVKHKQTKKQYALKIYSIGQLEKCNKKYSLKRSIKILQSLQSEKVIKLYQWAQDQNKFLMLYQVCKKGNFEHFISEYATRITQNIKKYYIIEMAQTLCYLLQEQIAHRDIKPSNFVIDDQGHLKLIDFDEAITFKPNLFNEMQDLEIIRQKFALRRKNTMEIKQLKEVEHLRSRQATFVGTICYMAPELTQISSYTESGDLWSFGCIIYELLTNKKYMNDQHQYSEQNYELKSAKINNKQAAKDLLKRLLKSDPKQRLSLNEILQHEYLKDFNNNPKLKEETRQQILKMLKNKKIVPIKFEELDQIKEIRLIDNFQFIESMKIDLLILKKGYYFYFPKYLVSYQNCFKILDASKTITQALIYFTQISSIQLIDSTIYVRDSQLSYRFKVVEYIMQHIKAQLTQHLYEIILSFFEI